MKALAAIAVVVGLVGASPRAGAAPPDDATARKAWDALAFEAKWLRYRSDAAPLKDWVKFLGGANEVALLEWVALTTRESVALDELVRLDAPPWIRVAVWRLETADSHSIGGAATTLLSETRPAVVLDWFDRHPEAVKWGAVGVVKKLRERQPPLVAEPSGAFLPPLEPEVVLKALTPPTTVFDYGTDRTRSPAPDDVYVHQVERALDAWKLTTLRTPVWTARVFSLLRHARPEIRRATALACIRLAPDDIPASALDALVEDENEPPDVRAAAVLAVSYVPGNERWLWLHTIAAQPAHVGWSAAVSRLADVGDEFSVKRLEALPSDALDAPATKLRTDVVSGIRAHLLAQDPAALATRLVAMLERAAFVDLACGPFEAELVPFALATAKTHVSDPAVRDAVRGAIERLRDGADSEDATRKRMAEYAAEILGPVSPPLDVKPPR